MADINPGDPGSTGATDPVDVEATETIRELVREELHQLELEPGHIEITDELEGVIAAQVSGHLSESQALRDVVRTVTNEELAERPISQPDRDLFKSAIDSVNSSNEKLRAQTEEAWDRSCTF